MRGPFGWLKSLAMPAADRRQAFRLGLDAEAWAALWLQAKGYRILARRYLRAGGEIDLVVRRGGVLVFVEVKARPSHDEALASITPGKLARISRAARAFLAGMPGGAAIVRCDAVLVAPWRWPRHVEAIGELSVD